MSEPIAYCVDLEEDALIEASKILGLEPTDVKFLQMPLYTHPMRELTDSEISEEAKKWGLTGLFSERQFAKAIIKKSRGEK